MLVSMTSIVAMLFGGIHCAAWNFPFPSQTDLITWRVSSSIIVAVPCIFLILSVCTCGTGERASNDMSVYDYFVFPIVLYGLARLTLFVIAFIALWHLPPGAYAVVEWTALLLHM